MATPYPLAPPQLPLMVSPIPLMVSLSNHERVLRQAQDERANRPATDHERVLSRCPISARAGSVSAHGEPVEPWARPSTSSGRAGEPSGHRPWARPSTGSGPHAHPVCRGVAPNGISQIVAPAKAGAQKPQSTRNQQRRLPHWLTGFRPRSKYLTGLCNGRLVEVFTPILTFPHQGEGTLIEIPTPVRYQVRGEVLPPE